VAGDLLGAEALRHQFGGLSLTWRQVHRPTKKTS
jgi:hypothetical protein